MSGERGGTRTERGAGSSVGRGVGHKLGWTRLLVTGFVLALAVTGLTATEASAGPPTSVTGLSATVTSSASGATGNWTVGFTTSSSGAMPGIGSTVSVILPAGSSPGPVASDVVTDTTTSQTVSFECTNPGGTTVTCTANDGNAVSAGDTLSVALYGVTSPATTGPVTFSASTSADTQAASASVTLTTAQAVTGVTATETSTAAGAQVAWHVGFTASSTGALEGTAGSTVTVTLPTGTTFASYGGGIMTDTTTGNNLDYGCTLAGGTSLSCAVFLGQTVNPGDVVAITIRVVTNPSTTGSGVVSVSTSSDLSTTTPAPVTADQAVTGVTVSLVSTAANAETTWTTALTASSTGALDSAAASTIDLTLPAGTAFPSFAFSMITDTTTAQTVSYEECTMASGTTVACSIGPGSIVNAGDTLSVLLRSVVNPSTTGPATVSVSTTSDLTSSTAPLTITPAQSVTGLTVSPSSTEAGVQANWTFGFTSSSTGAFAPFIGHVLLTLPPGTTFGHFTGGVLTDTTAGGATYNCTVVSGTTVSCLVYFSTTVAAGDTFSVVLDGVTNTLTTGPTTVSVSTSVDTKAKTAPVTITGVTCAKVSGKLSGSISVKKCTPKSATNKSAKGPGASLTSSGTVTWKKSNQTTVIAASTSSSLGQGGCKHGSIERDVTGSVTGGTSTYTHSGDYVDLRLCQTGAGAISLVKGTKALF
ncbi:MAG TPA: hypothetical protein VN796_05085 [Acidimicrobiales bacterium]|nr:hypothetical protein [Acidimicrobiales bacterium]